MKTYELDWSSRLFVAQAVLGIWLKTWDKWCASNKPLFRGAATVARVRGILAHDRILTKRDPRINNCAGQVPAERKE